MLQFGFSATTVGSCHWPYNLSKVTCLPFSTLPDSSYSLEITVLYMSSCTYFVFVHISIAIFTIKCSFTFYYFPEIYVSQEDSCILYMSYWQRKEVPETATKANFAGVFLLFIGEIITSINIKYNLFIMPLILQKYLRQKMFLNARKYKIFKTK